MEVEETGSQQLKTNQGYNPDETEEKRNPKGKRELFLLAVCPFVVTCVGEGNPVIARHWRKLSVLVSGCRRSRAKLECENGACRWQLQAAIQCFSPILRYLIYICWHVFFQKLGNVLFQVGKVQTNRWLMVKLASPAVGEETEHMKYQFWMQICGAQSCAKLLFKLDYLHVNKALTVWASAWMEFLRMELAAGQRDGAVPVNSWCPHRAQSSSWWVSGLKGLWAPQWHSLWLGTAGLGLVWIKAPTLNIGPVSSCRRGFCSVGMLNCK